MFTQTRAARFIDTPGTNCHACAGMARCARCKTAQRVDGNAWKGYAGYGRYTTHYEWPVLVCSCGKDFPMINPIQGTVTEHVCNGKCTSSKGFICECSCGGKNHGINA